MNKKIAVFAGGHAVSVSDVGYFALAYKTGKLLAENGFTVVSGAGPGLMDEALKGAIEAKGQTIGVGLNIPNRKHSSYAGEISLFDRLGPRQDKLIELGDAYLALPGGLGTMYEIFNILALKRLNEISPKKPLVLVGRYFNFVDHLFEKMIAEGFIDKSVFTGYQKAETPEQAVKILKSFFGDKVLNKAT